MKNDKWIVTFSAIVFHWQMILYFSEKKIFPLHRKHSLMYPFISYKIRYEFRFRHSNLIKLQKYCYINGKLLKNMLLSSTFSQSISKPFLIVILYVSNIQYAYFSLYWIILIILLPKSCYAIYLTKQIMCHSILYNFVYVSSLRYHRVKSLYYGIGS